MGVIVNLVNSVVPAMCEYYKKLDLDHRKIVGVTTLDVVRTGSSMRDAQIPVIGGHVGVTTLWAARPRGSGGGSGQACARWRHLTGLGARCNLVWQLRACGYAAHSRVR